MDIFLTIVCLASVLFFAFFQIQLMRLRRQVRFPLRGLVKAINLETIHFDKEQKKTVVLWLWSVLVLTLSPWLWFFRLYLASDYSFLIGLYPFAWYYLVTRFFLWEKSDLLDTP